MRPLRELCVVVLALGLSAVSAQRVSADGEVSMRGAYYKEEATRVVQPMLDARFDVGDDGELATHGLIDAITSASVAAGAAAEPFTERRYEAGAAYSHRLEDLVLGGSARYSDEPDYQSIFVSLRGELALAQDNTLVGAALARGADDISNAGARGGLGEPISGELSTTLGSLSITQLLSPTTLIGATYDLMYLSGFQENPYRTVIAGGTAQPERVPATRWRHAVFASARRFVPNTRTTVFGGYRFYTDDWGIIAHTPELRVIQELRTGLELSVRGRFHTQRAADFFRDIYDTDDPNVEPYLTDDEKLSAFHSYHLGVKADVLLGILGVHGDWSRARAELLAEYIVQDNDFGNAVQAQAALTIPFDY